MLLIKPTTIRGMAHLKNGVFADRDIEKGTVIAQLEGPLMDLTHVDYHTFKRCSSNLLEINMAIHKQGIGRHIRDPFKLNMPSDTYRNVNDCFNIGDIDFFSGHVNTYEIMSKRVSNVDLIEHEFVSNRNIKAGSELFMHYGVKYWFIKSCLKSSSALDKLYWLLVTMENDKNDDVLDGMFEYLSRAMIKHEEMQTILESNNFNDFLQTTKIFKSEISPIFKYMMLHYHDQRVEETIDLVKAYQNNPNLPYNKEEIATIRLCSI